MWGVWDTGCYLGVVEGTVEKKGCSVGVLWGIAGYCWVLLGTTGYWGTLGGTRGTGVLQGTMEYYGILQGTRGTGE